MKGIPVSLAVVEDSLRSKGPIQVSSEHGDCKVMVSIDLERWSKRSSWFFLVRRAV